MRMVGVCVVVLCTIGWAFVVVRGSRVADEDELERWMRWN